MPTSSSTVHIPSRTHFLTCFCLLIPCLRVCHCLPYPESTPHCGTSSWPPLLSGCCRDGRGLGEHRRSCCHKPGRRRCGCGCRGPAREARPPGQFCSDAARPGGRRGLPARPGHHRDKTRLGGRRRYRWVALYANGAVAMSLDAERQLALSLDARDHVATTDRLRRVIVAARAVLRTPSRRPRSQGAPSLASRPPPGPRPPSQRARTRGSSSLCPRPPGTML